jgi:hypothetical protein
MSNYTRKIGEGTNFLSPTDFIVEVDTSQGEVIMYLPLISTVLASESPNLQQFMGVRFVDVSNNASVNNIIIRGLGDDTVNGGEVVLKTDGVGGLINLISNSKWSFQQNTTESSGGITEYRMNQLPSLSYTSQSLPQPNLYGIVMDEALRVNYNQPLIILENGNLGQVSYCQSVLNNGIYIYEVYDIQTVDSLYGYWVAFKQNEQNPKLLEKVAELKMTEQFWDNWYDYTVKNVGDSGVKYVTSTYISNDEQRIESYHTTLTYANGVLNATDEYLGFNGATALSLWNSLSPTPKPLDAQYDSFRAEYILDDDYYGMALGTQAGWSYYKLASSFVIIDEPFNCVGYNILTGETRFVKLVDLLTTTVTNFDFTGFLPDKNIGSIINHPNGLSITLSNALEVNGGNNVNGVTAIWSPYYENSNEVLYIDMRSKNDGGKFRYIGGDIKIDFNQSGYYWDNENYYFWQFQTSREEFVYIERGYIILIERYNTNTKQKTSWNIPYIPLWNTESFVPSWANNNGVLISIDAINQTEERFFNQPYFGVYNYIYLTNNIYPYSLQSNNIYPTNMIGNKSYSVYSQLLRNSYSLGVQVDEYSNINF